MDTLAKEALKLIEDADEGPWMSVEATTTDGTDLGFAVVKPHPDGALICIGGLSEGNANFIARSRVLVEQMAQRIEELVAPDVDEISIQTREVLTAIEDIVERGNRSPSAPTEPTDEDVAVVQKGLWALYDLVPRLLDALGEARRSVTNGPDS
jgi:hypothetical protein